MQFKKDLQFVCAFVSFKSYFPDPSLTATASNKICCTIFQPAIYLALTLLTPSRSHSIKYLIFAVYLFTSPFLPFWLFSPLSILGDRKGSRRVRMREGNKKISLIELKFHRALTAMMARCQKELFIYLFFLVPRCHMAAQLSHRFNHLLFRKT